MSITAEKQIRRAERERELAAKEIAAGTVGVVYGLHPVELPDNVDKKAVLVLQTSGVDLEEALKSVDRLGFKYKAMCVLRMNRSAPHLVLVATRGKIPAPAPGTQSASVLAEPITDWIGRTFPNMPLAQI